MQPADKTAAASCQPDKLRTIQQTVKVFMKKILVLYYSQSGQLEEIMRHLAAPPTSGQDAQM